MKREGLWAVFAGALLAAGLLVGFFPVHEKYGVSCGSPFTPGDDVSVERCEPKLNSNRSVAILLIAVGAAGLLTAGVANGASSRRDSSSSEQTAAE